jgi:hypothetical protein
VLDNAPAGKAATSGCVLLPPQAVAASFDSSSASPVPLRIRSATHVSPVPLRIETRMSSKT